MTSDVEIVLIVDVIAGSVFAETGDTELNSDEVEILVICVVLLEDVIKFVVVEEPGLTGVIVTGCEEVDSEFEVVDSPDIVDPGTDWEFVDPTVVKDGVLVDPNVVVFVGKETVESFEVVLVSLSAEVGP